VYVIFRQLFTQFPVRNWQNFSVTPNGYIPVHTRKILPIFN
jgi:muconolactone delta-isomerase